MNLLKNNETPLDRNVNEHQFLGPGCILRGVIFLLLPGIHDLAVNLHLRARICLDGFEINSRELKRAIAAVTLHGIVNSWPQHSEIGLGL